MRISPQRSLHSTKAVNNPLASTHNCSHHTFLNLTNGKMAIIEETKCTSENATSRTYLQSISANHQCASLQELNPHSKAQALSSLFFRPHDKRQAEVDLKSCNRVRVHQAYTGSCTRQFVCQA